MSATRAGAVRGKGLTSAFRLQPSAFDKNKLIPPQPVAPLAQPQTRETPDQRIQARLRELRAQNAKLRARLERLEQLIAARHRPQP